MTTTTHQIALPLDTAPMTRRSMRVWVEYGVEALLDFSYDNRPTWVSLSTIPLTCPRRAWQRYHYYVRKSVKYRDGNPALRLMRYEHRRGGVTERVLAEYEP